jgi:hypothetical protein
MPLMSTARMMLDFAKANVDIRDLPVDEMPKLKAAAARTAITFVKMARMSNQLTDPQELEDSFITVQTILDKIKAKNTAPAKVAYEEHKKKFSVIEESINKDNAAKLAIRSQFTTSKQSVIDQLKAIIASVKLVKDLQAKDDAAGNQSVLNTIKTTRGLLDPFNVSITNLNKNIEALKQIKNTAMGYLSLDEQKVYKEKEAAAKKDLPAKQDTPGAAPAA